MEENKTEETKTEESSGNTDKERIGAMFAGLAPALASLPAPGRCDIVINIHVGEKVANTNYYRETGLIGGTSV